MRGWQSLLILLVFSHPGAARSIQHADRRVTAQGSEFDKNPSRVSNSNKGTPSLIELSLDNISAEAAWEDSVLVKRVKRGAPKFLKNILGKIPGLKKLINKKKDAAGGDTAAGTAAGTTQGFMAKVKAWLKKIGGKRAGKYAAGAVSILGVAGVIAAMAGRSNGGLPAMGMGGYGGLPHGWNAWRGR